MSSRSPNSLAVTFVSYFDKRRIWHVLWVVGSLLYVSSIVLVLNRLFIEQGQGGPQPAPDWDDDDRMIMPGLEHRLRQ